MYINATCNLVLSNLFEYDIASCFYRILKATNYQKINQINPYDKNQRNITIGLLQKGNRRLTTFLHRTTERIIQQYLEVNKVKNKEIILRQKDGFILTRRIGITNLGMEIQLRGIISRMIITANRKSYLVIYDNGEVKVKGIPNKPIDISFYRLFSKLNYENNSQITKGIECIRQIIFNSNRKEWFAFEETTASAALTSMTTGGQQVLRVPIGNDFLKVSKSTLRSIDPNEINKKFVWDQYVWPFCQSLIIFLKHRRN